MKPYREMSEAEQREAKRLRAYVESLLGREDLGTGEKPEVQNHITHMHEMISIVNHGDWVSFVYFGNDGRMVAGCYERETGNAPSRPSLMKCHVNGGAIKFNGVMYVSPELLRRCGEDVQAVRIGDTLHIFDMCGKGIVDIKCGE